MISINKNTKPTILENDIIQTKLLSIKDTEKPGKKINNLYNDNSVRIALNELYNNKCAYCEGIANTSKFVSRIDHYRPKNGIKNIKNHKGYYWLAYEWTNLLPTCEKCNIKKSNQFPLNNEDTRISDNLEKEGFLQKNNFVFEKFNLKQLENEERLLLNPEIDKVEEHLYFSITGEIKHLTEKGKKSINVYDLNRSSLIFERRKIVDDMFREIFDILSNYKHHKELLKKFLLDKVAYSKKDEYSLFRSFVSNFFDIFIISSLKNFGFTEFSKILTEQYKIHIVTD